MLTIAKCFGWETLIGAPYSSRWFIRIWQSNQSFYFNISVHFRWITRGITAIQVGWRTCSTWHTIEPDINITCRCMKRCIYASRGKKTRVVWASGGKATEVVKYSISITHGDRYLFVSGSLVARVMREISFFQQNEMCTWVNPGNH